MASRITIVTAGTNAVIDQIKAQLDRLVPVHRVVDLTLQISSVEPVSSNTNEFSVASRVRAPKAAASRIASTRWISRITIVTAGTNAVIDQIKAQLDRLVPVHRVVDRARCRR
jgi:acetolactate synthase small subunit